MLRLLALASLAALAAAQSGTGSTVAAAAVSFYISPAGNDVSGDGTITAPWASPSRAATAVRQVNAGMSSDIYVYMRNGAYFMTETLELAPADSGMNGYSVHYASYPGETAVLDGGVPISNWQLVDAANNIWAAPLPALTRQIYIGEDRMNETWIGNATTFGYNLLSKDDTVITSTGYLTNNTWLLQAAQTVVPAIRPSTEGGAALTNDAASRSGAAGATPQGAQQSASDVEFLYRMEGCQWVEDRVRVASWELVEYPAGSGLNCLNITFVQPGWYMIRNKNYPDSYPSHVFGLYAALAGSLSAQDSNGLIGGDRDVSSGASGSGDGDGTAVPGSGYVHWDAPTNTGTVFYKARAVDGDMSAVSAWAAVLDGPLVRLTGDRYAEPSINPVSSIAFENVTFQHNTWTGPSGQCAYVPDQSGIIFNCSDVPSMPGLGHATHPVPGSFELHTAHNITVSGCVFKHVGSTGITVDDGSQFVAISRSFFWDTSCHAVRFGQVSVRESADVDVVLL